MDRFVPFLGPVLESLVTLLREVETNGAKRRVIGVLVVVIGASKERVSELPNDRLPSLSPQFQITPLLVPLVAPIPALCRFQPYFLPISSHLTETGEDPTSDATMKASLIEMTVALIKVRTKSCITKQLYSTICTQAAKEQSGSIAHLVTAMVTASMQPPVSITPPTGIAYSESTCT